MTNLTKQIRDLDEELLNDPTVTQLQWAETVAKRRDLYHELHPEAVKHGGDRRSDPRSNRYWCRIASFAEDTAGALGISVPTINRMLRRADKIDPVVKSLIADHYPDIADSAKDLDCLAGCESAKQQRHILHVITEIRDAAERKKNA